MLHRGVSFFILVTSDSVHLSVSMRQIWSPGKVGERRSPLTVWREESTAYGAPALKVHGKLLARVPSHRSAEPGSLAVSIDFDNRAELLAA